jgi:P27 family predicted phage terminase small subunit
VPGRGFPPAPAAVKLARGETRPSRVNYSEPLPPEGPLDCPRDMDAIAKRTWARILATMPVGVLYPVDLDLLRGYCESVSRYVESARLLAASTPTLAGEGGRRVRNPLHQIARDNLDQMRQLARELGIGPAARASLRVESLVPAGALLPGDLDDLGLPPRLQAIAGGRSA